MAYYNIAKELTTSDADIVLCPASTQGAAVAAVANKTNAPVVLTMKQYVQALGTTVTVAIISVSAYGIFSFPAPISLLAGDKIIMQAASNSALVVHGVFNYKATSPVKAGWKPRGVWSSGATYDQNDVVSRSGNVYYAIQGANTNQDPVSATTYWMIAPVTAPPASNTAQGILEIMLASEYLSAAAGFAVTPDTAWAAAAVVPITYGATPVLNFNTFINAEMTLTGNCAPTVSNVKDGQGGVIYFVQDGTGSRLMTWPAAWKWPGGTIPVLSTGINKVDKLFYSVRGSTVHAALEKDSR